VIGERMHARSVRLIRNDASGLYHADMGLSWQPSRRTHGCAWRPAQHGYRNSLRSTRRVNQAGRIYGAPLVITTLDELKALYGVPVEATIVKEVGRVAPHNPAFIEAWADKAKIEVVLEEIRHLDPQVIAGCHSPMARGRTDSHLNALHDLIGM
jgi:hypothetical protein